MMKSPRDRILVTRLNYLGDVVLSLPLIDALRARFPGVEIDYLTRRPGADLLAADARISRVLTLEPGTGWLSLVRTMRSRRYRAVIDLYSNPRSAWLTRASGAPVRIGGDRRGRRRLYTHPVRVPASVRRVTDIFLRYGAPLGLEGTAGKPGMDFGAEELERAGAVLDSLGIRGGPVIGIHPGGKWSVKRWHTGGFVELIALLRKETGAVVLVFTGPGEADATDSLRRSVGGDAIYAPVMGVRELGAVIARLDAMVACDGGVMHIAAAAGTPTVGIFGSSEPDIWFPYTGEGPYEAAYIDMECRPCHRHECPLGHTRCLNGLTAKAVMESVIRVLDARGAGARR